MMQVDISQEIHELRQDVTSIDKNVTRLTTMVEGLVEETKEQREKISLLQKFKNKMVGAFTISNFVLACFLIPLVLALL